MQLRDMQREIQIEMPREIQREEKRNIIMCQRLSLYIYIYLSGMPPTTHMTPHYQVRTCDKMLGVYLAFVGTFSDTEGATVCLDCPDGQYAPFAQSAECKFFYY